MTEYIDVVDETNKVQYQATREKVHSAGLWHRGVHVLIFNSDGRMLLPLRSPNKDKFPNCYDISISEHCGAGESYEEVARRGLREELRIHDPELTLLGIFKIECGPTDRMISALYKCLYDGDIEVNKEEIADIGPKTIQELKELLHTQADKFAPWTREILQWYFKQLSKIRPFKEHYE